MLKKVGTFTTPTGLTFPNYELITKETKLFEFNAGVEISFVKANVHASVNGRGFDLTWKFGKDPILATKVDDKLYLNVGDRWAQRGSGDVYKDMINEEYTITQLGDTVYVSGLGVVKAYKGINEIIGDGGEGNDTFIIDETVDKIINLKGGEGTDTFKVYGGALESNYYGGEGNDTFINATIGASYFGEGGNDVYTSADGFATINMWSGRNAITAGKGDDVIIVEDGFDTIDAGAGDDKIFVSDVFKNTKLNAGEGKDSLIFDNIISDEAFILASQTIRYKDGTINFDDALEGIEIYDVSDNLILSNETDYDLSSIDFTATATGVLDVNNVHFNSDANLTLEANGISGVVRADVGSLSVTNSSNDALYRDVNLEGTTLKLDNVETTYGTITLKTDALDLSDATALSSQNGVHVESLATNKFAIGSFDASVDLSDRLAISQEDFVKLGGEFDSIVIGDANSDILLSNLSASIDSDITFIANEIRLQGVVTVDNLTFNAKSMSVTQDINTNNVVFNIEDALSVSSTINAQDVTVTTLGAQSSFVVTSTAKLNLSDDLKINAKNSVTIDGSLVANGDNSSLVIDANVLTLNGVVSATNDIDLTASALTYAQTAQFISVNANSQLNVHLLENAVLDTAFNYNGSLNIKSDANLEFNNVTMALEGINFLRVESKGDIGLVGAT